MVLVVRDGSPSGRDDVASDRRALLRGTGAVALGYAVGASLQSAWIYATLVPAWAEVDLWRRLAANGLAVLGLVGLLAALRVHRAGSSTAIATRVGGAAVVVATARVLLQLLLGVHPSDDPRALATEVATGALLAAIAGTSGVWLMVSHRRVRAAARLAEREALSVELAVRALEAEEIRVRRRVAEGLHGTVQQRLLLVDARLARAEERARHAAPDVAQDIVDARAELARSREDDVRQMSRLLYPERLELGVAPAVRALLGRLPATIATALHVGDALRALDDPSRAGLGVAERLLAVRVVEEAVTNALKNGPPTLVEVTLDVVDGALHVRVVDDGGPFRPPAEPDPSSGTSRLGQRLHVAGGELRVERRRPTGAVVTAELPLGVLPVDAA